MRITVIGAGNMGGAIVRGLIASKFPPREITAVAVSDRTLNTMRELGVNATDDSAAAAKDADVVILAVKPWLTAELAQRVASHISDKAIVGSVAAGIDFRELGAFFKRDAPLFRIIPNIAVTVGEGVTFIASVNATQEQKKQMTTLFEPLGSVIEVEEKQLEACTALASCGIAFAMRYIRAAMEGGVELGIPVGMGQAIVAQTVKGAAEILLQAGTHPETEIDKVTTPGGMTIKGLNAMEQNGFTHAVIEGLKASK